jgi:4-amino-4-deoxy-L-arabinose transferase-like glycosyltransferase
MSNPLVRVATLLLATWASYTWLATRTTLWDRDEPRFARAAVEMVQGGGLLLPTFNGDLRPHKPILWYWLAAAAVKVLGSTELAARATSTLAAVGCVLLTWLLARRLLDPGGALLAAALLAAQPLVVLEGTAATADALLLACTTAALVVFADALIGTPSWRHTLGVAAALGAAQLAKGPVGLILPGGVMLATLLGLPPPSRRDLGRRVAIATAASVAVFLAWALPADAATGGRLAREGLGAQFLHRVASPMEGHGGFPLVGLPVYALAVVFGMVPASLHLAAAWRAREAMPAPLRRLLACWLGVPVLLLSLSATVLPHYVLPVAPAVAVLAAFGVRRGSTPHRGFTAVVLVLVVAGLAVAQHSLGLSGAWPVAAVIVVGGTVPMWLATRGSAERAAWAGVGSTVAAFAAVAVFVLPALEARKPVPRLAAAIRETTAATAPVVRLGFGEPSLDFYVDRAPIRTLPSADAARAWLAAGGPGVLVVTGELLPVLRPLPPHVREIGAAAGLDIVSGREVELVALRRD